MRWHRLQILVDTVAETQDEFGSVTPQYFLPVFFSICELKQYCNSVNGHSGSAGTSC